MAGVRFRNGRQIQLGSHICNCQKLCEMFCPVHKGYQNAAAATMTAATSPTKMTPVMRLAGGSHHCFRGGAAMGGTFGFGEWNSGGAAGIGE